MKKFKDIMFVTWVLAALAFLIAVVICVFVPEFSKDELSLALLGLIISVLTLITFFE